MSTLGIIPQDDWLKHLNEARITAPQARAIQLASASASSRATQSLNNAYRSLWHVSKPSAHPGKSSTSPPALSSTPAWPSPAGALARASAVPSRFPKSVLLSPVPFPPQACHECIRTKCSLAQPHWPSHLVRLALWQFKLEFQTSS
eukprot:1679885-Rhodomonas_salina.2